MRYCSPSHPAGKGCRGGRKHYGQEREKRSETSNAEHLGMPWECKPRAGAGQSLLKDCGASGTLRSVCVHQRKPLSELPDLLPLGIDGNAKGWLKGD